MMIKDIYVLQSVAPIKLVKRPSVKTLEFLNNLIKTKGLEDFIILTREQFKLPKKGAEILPLVGTNLYDLGDVIVNAYKLIVDSFVRDTGLPQEYTLEIFLLVVFNSIVDLRYFKCEPSNPHEFIFGRRKIADKMWEYSHEVGAVIIPFDISKTKLKKWIDLNWESITADMNNNFTTNPIILGTHKNLLLEEEISHLKDVDNKSFTEIFKIFKEKYPKDRWKLSRITKIYYDARQRNNLVAKVK